MPNYFHSTAKILHFCSCQKNILGVVSVTELKFRRFLQSQLVFRSKLFCLFGLLTPVKLAKRLNNFDTKKKGCHFDIPNA